MGLRTVLMPDCGKQWVVWVYRKDKFICTSDWHDKITEAICRAALLAVMGGNNND